jgi:hypothetical protein|tara:strand:- start:2214 stop:2486 length:273 start_codon:yes stop_codon:yes gene_type:complete
LAYSGKLKRWRLIGNTAVKQKLDDPSYYCVSQNQLEAWLDADMVYRVLHSIPPITLYIRVFLRRCLIQQITASKVDLGDSDISLLGQAVS